MSGRPANVLLAVVIVVAALLILSAMFSVLGFVLGIVIRGLPLLLVVGAVIFFMQGGKVHIDWPDSWRRR